MPCHELFIHTFQSSLQAVGMKRYSLTSGSWTTARENHNEAQNCAKCTIHSTLLHGERQPGLGSWGRCQQVAVPELGHRKELEFVRGGGAVSLTAGRQNAEPAGKCSPGSGERGGGRQVRSGASIRWSSGGLRCGPGRLRQG